MATGAKLELRLFDVSAKEDSQPACDGIQPFVSLGDLREEELTLPACATLEQDFFRLDGGMEPFPDQPQGMRWGLWSRQMSGADGRFGTPPVLRIGFTKSHGCFGLTLRFDEREQDWCSRLKVTWLDQRGNALAVRSFTPDRAKVFLRHKVEGFWGLELAFYQTQKPYRYLKLAGIDYGLELALGENEIVTAALLEEVSLAASQLSVNTLDFTLHMGGTEFSPLNPDSMFSVLQQWQQLSAYAVLDQPLFLGNYYLERWESGDKGDLKMHAVDAMGLMNQTRFLGGVYKDAPVVPLLDELFGLCGLEYRLEASLAGQTLAGYLPAGTVRDALWQIAFAMGGVVDCSRNPWVAIYPVPTRPTAMIDHGRKFAGQRLKLTPPVTGIDVTAHRYLPEGAAANVFEDSLPVGRSTVLFAEPVCQLVVTGAVLAESGANFATVQVEQAGQVTISGHKYADARQAFRVNATSTASNLAENRLRVEDATLVTPENAGEVAHRLMEYYGRPYQCEFSVLLGTEKAADMVMVRSLAGESLKGIIERVAVDLTGGCIAKIGIRAVRLDTRSQHYAGELLAGQDKGVL